MKRKGVSLPELLLVCIGIAIIVGIASVGITKGNETNKISQARTQVSAIANAVTSYKYDMGVYPPNLEALTTASGIYGPWLKPLPTADPFGTTSAGIDGTGGTSPYAYGRTTAGFAIWSLGKDKTNNSGGSGSAIPASFSGDDVGVFGQ